MCHVTLLDLHALAHQNYLLTAGSTSGDAYLIGLEWVPSIYLF